MIRYSGIPKMRYVDAACRIDFPSFIQKCCGTLRPSLQLNWNINALAYHLEQVRRGKIKRLIINMPPRSLKSTITSVAFPAFVLGHDPTKRIIAVSYGADLAKKLSNDFRAVVNAPWYQRVFHEMRISPNKDTESEVVTTRRGFRLATSIEGAVTGRGGNIVIVDDPLRPIDALSDSRRTMVNTLFFSTLVTRLDDPQTGAIILVMQRLHVDDLTGILLQSSDEWTVLSLPAIAEQEEYIQIADEKYHRRRIGDVIQAERQPLDDLEKRRSEIGPDTFAAQYQQNPNSPDRGMIKRDWIPRYDHLPVRDSSSYILQSWDTGLKQGEENDYSVCLTLLYQNNKYYLVDVLRDRFLYPILVERAISHARIHKPAKILIEDSGVGTALVPDLQRAGFPAIGVRPEHDKKTRMSIQSGKLASGQFGLPTKAPWLKDFETELFAFPNGRHDDQIDALGQALANQASLYMWNAKSTAGYDRFVATFAGW